MEKQYIVNISEPNFFISYRNRVLRTPVKLCVFQKDLDLIKIQCQKAGIRPKIEIYDPLDKNTKESEVTDFFDDKISESTETIIEEIQIFDSLSILEKLINKKEICLDGE